jgi:acetone carboxylase gamma subunit
MAIRHGNLDVELRCEIRVEPSSHVLTITTGEYNSKVECSCGFWFTSSRREFVEAAAKLHGKTAERDAPDKHREVENAEPWDGTYDRGGRIATAEDFNK